MGHRLIVDPLQVQTPAVLFDMTRLIRSLERPVATGIDRIDLAIGRDLAARFGPRCRFVHVMGGGVAHVPGDLARAVLAYLDAHWHDATPAEPPPWLSLRLLAARARGALAPAVPDAAATTYIVASHSGVFRHTGLIDRIDPAAHMPRLVYIHDLIPLEHPAYQTATSVETFRAWLTEAARGPVQFVVNSRDTGARLARHADNSGWTMHEPRLHMPRLEATQTAPERPRSDHAGLFAGDRAVFLALGTIEPRKNHALLLDIWRAFANDMATPPLLLISGRRGWMNAEVFEALDRDERLSGHVHEFADLTDAEVAYAMSHAQALLFPSFAEGLGIPVMEAALHGLPVIASDLPALREIAADSTVFLAPGDTHGWTQAILAASAEMN
ncbi:MAG: glycosyltransferase [Pseudomonadota bacterium]